MAAKTLALEAMHKLREGKALSAEEEKAYRDYYRRYNERAIKVYFDDPAELERFKKQADQEGVAKFSQWILKKTRLGASGKLVDADYVEDLRSQAAMWREKYEQERDQAEAYRREGRELAQQNRTLTDKVQEYADEFVRIAKALGEETRE